MALPQQEQEVIVVCARCAQALGKSDQVLLSGVEFESASQVGSHASYPQWGSEGQQKKGALCWVNLVSLCS